MALLSAMERSHRTYWETWESVTELFGIKIGDRLSDEQFEKLAAYLSAERGKWLAAQRMERQRSRQAKARRRVQSNAASTKQR